MNVTESMPITALSQKELWGITGKQICGNEYRVVSSRGDSCGRPVRSSLIGTNPYTYLRTPLLQLGLCPSQRDAWRQERRAARLTLSCAGATFIRAETFWWLWAWAFHRADCRRPQPLRHDALWHHDLKENILWTPSIRCIESPE